MVTKPKNPFVSGTEEEVFKLEAKYYVIQIGPEFFSYGDKMVFTMERAEKFMEDIVEGLREMLCSEDPEDRMDAKRCLALVRILPLRIH
jgi:hypothetical protein